MSKFIKGDKVHYANANGVYIGIFNVLGSETKWGEQRYFLEDDGNPEHYSIREDQLKLADRFSKVGKEES